MDFEDFAKSYKPHIRPPDLVNALSKAFRLDAGFREEFRVLKPYLPAHKSDWGETVVNNLVESKSITRDEDGAKLNKIRSLYRHHSVIFRAGKFDEEYLDSIEDIALFFAFCDIKTLWVSSAYRDLTSNIIDFIYERQRLNRGHSVRFLMRAVTGALALELNQIQRTFTMYEKYVSDALVKDLTFGGMLTGGAKGLAPGRGKNTSE